MIVGENSRRPGPDTGCSAIKERARQIGVQIIAYPNDVLIIHQRRIIIIKILKKYGRANKWVNKEEINDYMQCISSKQKFAKYEYIDKKIY